MAKVKQKAVSIVIYGLNLVLLFSPWIVIEDAYYNLLWLAVKMRKPGLEALISNSNVMADDLNVLKVEIWLQLAVLGLFMLCCIGYIVALIRNRSCRMNMAAFF